MTTSFISETSDQELQICDLQQFNGGSAPMLLALWGIGVATGAMGMWLYENVDREKLADAVHDAISEEDDASSGKTCK